MNLTPDRLPKPTAVGASVSRQAGIHIAGRRRLSFFHQAASHHTIMRSMIHDIINDPRKYYRDLAFFVMKHPCSSVSICG